MGPAALMLLLSSALGAQPPAGSSQAPAMPLTLRDYTELALKQGLRFEITLDSLASSRYSRQASLRALYLPTVTADGSIARDFVDSDVTAKTRTDSFLGGLTVTQPLPTGTDLSVGSHWRRSQTIYADTTAKSNTRIVPQVTGTLTQPLYFFTGNPRLRTWRRTNIAWRNAQDQYESDRLGIILNAREQYYTMVQREESVAVEQAKVASAKRVHAISKQLVKAGRLAPVELSRADIRLNRDLRRIQTAESDRAQAMTSGKDFVRLPQDTPVVLATKLEYSPFTLDLAELLARAMRQNQSLRIAERQIALAELDLSQSRETTRPTLTAAGSYSYDHDRSLAGATRDPRSWGASIDLSWPLFDATQTALRARQREISLANARRSYEETRRQVDVAVRNAYTNLRRTEDQVKEFDIQRKAAKSNLEAVRLQYQNGLARLIDAFDAENEQRDLELEYLGLIIGYYRQRDALSRQVGVDLEEAR